MLIIARRGHFFVFVPDDKTILKLVCVKRIDPRDDRAKARGMTWVSLEVGEHVFCCCTQVGRVRTWRVELRADESVIFHDILDFQSDHDKHFEAIAVTKEVRCCISGHNQKNLHSQPHWLGNCSRRFQNTWKRQDWDSYYDAEGGFRHPMFMFATGEILVSSSAEGIVLCVWDMRRPYNDSTGNHVGKAGYFRDNHQRFC